MSSTVDIRLQRAAVALAAELNYARAAQRLHISQSALTKQIRELESQINGQLFERDKRHVTLLRPGEHSTEQAKLAIIHSERAVHFISEPVCADGSPNNLLIGRSPYTWMDFVNQLLAIELPLFPKLRVQLESGFSPFLAKIVLNGSMDLALAIGLPEMRGLVQVELRRDQCYVALPPSHPALSRDQVFLRDLDKNNWALFAESVHPWLYDSVLSIIREEGLSPRGLQHITTPNEGIALVEDQDWISFIVHGSLVFHFRQREVALRPLADNKIIRLAYQYS